jgi:hypothetical protein
MLTVMGQDVLAAADACMSLLTPTVGRDWSAPVPGLDFTVASVVAHAAEGPLWYALDLWGGPQDSAAFTVAVDGEATNSAILTSLLSAAHVCAASVDAAPPATRGFHSAGPADPSGFAAMACDELLIHGDDAARGQGMRLTPPPGLAARVLARLFPWHPADRDPWDVLLWAKGRIDLPGLPKQREWRWHCAPLAEWDGHAPVTGG